METKNKRDMQSSGIKGTKGSENRWGNDNQETTNLGTQASSWQEGEKGSGCCCNDSSKGKSASGSQQGQGMSEGKGSGMGGKSAQGSMGGSSSGSMSGQSGSMSGQSGSMSGQSGSMSGQQGTGQSGQEERASNKNKISTIVLIACALGGSAQALTAGSYASEGRYGQSYTRPYAGPQEEPFARSYAGSYEDPYATGSMMTSREADYPQYGYREEPTIRQETYGAMSEGERPSKKSRKPRKKILGRKRKTAKEQMEMREQRGEPTTKKRLFRRHRKPTGDVSREPREKEYRSSKRNRKKQYGPEEQQPKRRYARSKKNGECTTCDVQAGRTEPYQVQPGMGEGYSTEPVTVQEPMATQTRY